VRPEELDDALEPFELVANGLAGRLTFEEMKALMEHAPLPTAYERLELILFPDDAAVWGLMLNLYDYDPRPALERVRVPVLALFGGDDRIVPVEASVSVYREAVRPELLTVAVFAGADHRVQAGDPLTMVDGYLQTLTDFVLQAVA
jgi:pimeloyl-ACP methyl ester carboxylesterase